MPYANNQRGPGLAELFLAHAGGYRTPRALEVRRKSILMYLSENKYRITEEQARPLYEELAEITAKLEGENAQE